jgi:hypothetical protein
MRTQIVNNPQSSWGSIAAIVISLLISDSCMATPESAVLQQAESNKVTIFEIFGNDSQKHELYSYDGVPDISSAISPDHQVLIYRNKGQQELQLHNQKNGTTKSLNKTQFCNSVIFARSKPIAAWTCDITPEEPDNDKKKFEVQLFDFKKGSVVKKFKGYGASVAYLDDSIFFLEKERKVNRDTVNINVYNFLNEKPVVVKTIDLSSEGGPYGIAEVVALSKDRYFYLDYSEEENRYYGADDKPFYHDTKGFPGEHWKVQNNLTFSRDGKMAALTERNWNELTYLVVKDMVTGKSVRTNFYGIFPSIIGIKTFFFSEPSIVKGQIKPFRQINDFTLYSYDYSNNKLESLGSFQGSAEWVH